MGASEFFRTGPGVRRQNYPLAQSMCIAARQVPPEANPEFRDGELPVKAFIPTIPSHEVGLY